MIFIMRCLFLKYLTASKIPTGMDKSEGVSKARPHNPSFFLVMMTSLFMRVNFFGGGLCVCSLLFSAAFLALLKKKSLRLVNITVPAIPPLTVTVNAFMKENPAVTATNTPPKPNFTVLVAKTVNISKNSFTVLIFFLQKPDPLHLLSLEQYTTLRLILHPMIQSRYGYWKVNVV
jgi:hypothetical protein